MKLSSICIGIVFKHDLVLSFWKQTCWTCCFRLESFCKYFHIVCCRNGLLITLFRHVFYSLYLLLDKNFRFFDRVLFKKLSFSFWKIKPSDSKKIGIAPLPTIQERRMSNLFNITGTTLWSFSSSNFDIWGNQCFRLHTDYSYKSAFALFAWWFMGQTDVIVQTR